MSKFEFVLSVLLYLSKVQYEKDVYVWSKVIVVVDIHVCRDIAYLY